MIPRRLLLVAVLVVSACGYFNSLYNARRHFDEAVRAEQRGEMPAAARAYNLAIEKAAISYRGHPDGRWADDALFLMGRARFALGQYDAARAAFLTLLLERPEFDARADAHAYLGAAEVALGNRRVGVVHLDTAITANVSGQAAVLAHLWRARSEFAEGAAGATAWADLEIASAAAGPAAMEASLEMATRGLETGDTTRVRTAYERLLLDRTAARHSDSVATLTAAAARADAGWARAILEPVLDGRWPAADREVHLLDRARLAAMAGDTALAIADAIDLAGRSTAGAAGRARVLAATYQLARIDDVTGLADVRATLLPAVDQPDARTIIRFIKAVEVLLEQAGTGQPLAFFAAAEWARDELGAPRLARQLFLAYADVVPLAIWAPKSLLAAAALPATDAERESIVARIEAGNDNVYSQAVLEQADATAFQTAEVRLRRSLRAIREGALREADTRDIRVGVAIAMIDSLRATAAADSMRLSCGTVVDSLAIVGIRADSLVAACMRSDTARMNAVLRADTLALTDTARLRLDSLRAGIDTSSATSSAQAGPAPADLFGDGRH